MELTNNILEYNGFDCNHPERPLKKYSFSLDDKYYISLEQQYKPRTNKLGWALHAWLGDEEAGTVERRIHLSFIETLEELNTAIALCGIDLMLLPND